MIDSTGKESNLCILISIFRRIEGKPVADRLIEIWSCILKVVEFWGKWPKSKRLVCKSYSPVVEAAQDPLAVAKHEFVSLFASHFRLFCCLLNSQPSGTVFVSKSFQTQPQNYATCQTRFAKKMWKRYRFEEDWSSGQKHILEVQNYPSNLHICWSLKSLQPFFV